MTRSMLLCALALAFSGVAQAQEEEEAEGPFSGELTLTSDYVFRGISQTNEDPALQGGLTWTFDSGFYVGGWASNVEFVEEDDADVEVDLYVGWATDINDSWAVDVSLVGYLYPGTADGYDYDYTELIGVFTYDEWLSLTAGLSNDVFNLDEFAGYYEVAGNWELPAEFYINAHFGYYTTEDALGFDYTNFGAGITKDIGPLSWALSWSDTNGKGKEIFGQNAGSRVYASVTFAF